MCVHYEHKSHKDTHPNSKFIYLFINFRKMWINNYIKEEPSGPQKGSKNITNTINRVDELQQRNKDGTS